MATNSMQQLLRKLVKVLAYIGAALVILLAVAVGLFRLLLPRLPEYQEEIKDWANAAIGMSVEFTDMDARWRLSGPELTFQDAELAIHAGASSLLAVGEVSVGVSLMRLITERELVVNRIQIRETKLTLQRSEQDGWLVQGLPVEEILAARQQAGPEQDSVLIIAEDIEIDYSLPDSDEILSFTLDSLKVARDQTGTVIDALLDLPKNIGQRLSVSASQRKEEAQQQRWQFFVEGKNLSLPGLADLHDQRIPAFQSGGLSLSASLQMTDAAIDHATADLVLRDVAVVGSSIETPIDVAGRVEFSNDAGGWLVALSNLVVDTVEGAWPRASISIAASSSMPAELQGISVSASFLKLDDWRYVDHWLPEKFQSMFGNFDPSGVLLDVRLDLNHMQGSEPGFAVEAELVDVGFAATESLAGFRQISGKVRASNFGGRFEIDSEGLIVDVAAQLAEPISFDDAVGTLVWRRNAQGITVLSDNILIRNADLDSESSLQISIPAGAGAPVVDFQSNWSVNDISAVGRYLPTGLVKPGLYRWLTTALVEGNVPRGSTQLTGPLDKFPFDNGEGVFRIDARLENATLLYSEKWPAAKNMALDVVVDGVKLHSYRNSSSNAGNNVENARIDIVDLRRPILTIDAFATGSLQSIREFSRSSPIAQVFGGHLDELNVAGDASFKVQFSFPILDRSNYTFSTRIQTNGGRLSFEGFAPELTELNGIVNVTRDGVSSESLFGRFLGEQIDIELRSAGAELPLYTVIAEASGRLTDEGLVSELAPPLREFIDGSTNYRASIRFPKAGLEQPAPLQIKVQTDLRGMAISLPEPLEKHVESEMPLSFAIEFPVEGRIDTTGRFGDNLNWTMSFLQSEESTWDFDRGTLAAGDSLAKQPEVRGLHIVGRADRVSLDDWLAVSRRESGKINVVERIRSADIVIDNFHVIGQDLKDHRINLQRSAQDWLVSLSGEQVSGLVTVPYDFSAGRPLIADMDSLILPGTDELLEDATGDTWQADPREIPPISIKAKHFGLGERLFGELSAEFASTEHGVESTLLVTKDSSFAVEGSAKWIVNAKDDSGQRTYLSAKLISSDVESTMQRLNFEPGISGEKLQMELDVSWSGGPRQDFLAELDGEVSLRLGSGMLEDVEPGAGRVFGLMSIVALPRRLSLDFRDVFEKGFGFDSIKGDFHIESGQAYTCDLSLEGPAADVGIVGRAGLATRDYDQTAIVSANIGNTLPIVGAVVAGPQVAAALLIFSQIFKKPLQEVGQVYYAIDGSWDFPDITAANPERFAVSSSASGCLAQNQPNQ